jgi:hypothetical protein
MLKATVNIGKTAITVEAEGQKELFKEVGFFSELPCKCGSCKSENITLSHRKIKNFDFYSVVCMDCKHEFALGQKKEDGSLFPKGEWKPPYTRDGGSGPDDWS